MKTNVNILRYIKLYSAQQKCSSHNIQEGSSQEQKRNRVRKSPRRKLSQEASLSLANFLLCTECDAHGRDTPVSQHLVSCTGSLRTANGLQPIVGQGFCPSETRIGMSTDTFCLKSNRYFSINIFLSFIQSVLIILGSHSLFWLNCFLLCQQLSSEGLQPAIILLAFGNGAEVSLAKF